MFGKLFGFEIVKGETEHISFSGKRARRPTVLIRVGRLSLSKKAFLLGLTLAICQVLDGLLTYVGLSLLGVHMEGNAFIRTLVIAYGAAPALFMVKLIAILLATLLMFQAHQRRWVRPLIAMLILIYFGLAVVPWTYIISATSARMTSENLMSPESAQSSPQKPPRERAPLPAPQD
jgi:hypothetical protein